jgi:lysophospholipase L1-like esterase
MLRRVLSAAVVAAVASAVLAAPPAEAHHDPWTGAWTTAEMAAVPDFFIPNWSAGFDDQSVRQVVRTSRAGSAVRIELSNVYGESPLRLTGATIGRAGDGAAVRPGTVRTVTFHGSRSTVVAPGREKASDAVPLRVSPLERLTVTLYFATPTGPSTFHPMAMATSYRASGNHLYDRSADAYGETSQSWYYLSGVDVIARPTNAVVAFGDSITDGAFSTPDADNRYPDELAERLVAARRPIGVLNAGIGGNRLLTDSAGFGDKATARFERDVLDQPGVRTVIVLEGVNDIGLGDEAGTPVTAAQLIGAHRALIRAAHARGVRAIGATILPFKGTIYPDYYTERGEAVRDAVNDWIRTSGEYDAVVDFDRAMADPADPDLLRPAFDAGDGLHPNDAGYHAMAEAVDLDTLLSGG